MKKLLLMLAFLAVVTVASPAFAKSVKRHTHGPRTNTSGGTNTCDDTPENPTLVLAGLAGGVYGLRQMRGRLRARRALRRDSLELPA